MKRVDVVYALIVNEKNHILLVKNKRGESFDYTLPGGAVEKGETLKEALIRETNEETGLEIEVGEIVEVAEAFFLRKEHHALLITFLSKIIGGEEKISKPDEILETKWVSASDINKYVTRMTSKAIETYQKQSASYIQWGRVK